MHSENADPVSGPRKAPVSPDQPTVEAIVASAALVFSMLSLSSSAWFALRESVVTTVPPDGVFFYRDAGVDAGEVPVADIDTSLVNSASGNYGGVFTRIAMKSSVDKREYSPRTA